MPEISRGIVVAIATCVLSTGGILALGQAPAQAHHHHHGDQHHASGAPSEDENDHGTMIIAAPVESVPTPPPAPAAVPTPSAATTTAPPPAGSLIACAANLKDASAIVRVEFDGPAFRQASLLNGDCQTFGVPVGPYHFTTPATGNNPCGLFTTLDVLIRRDGINYKPTSSADFATWVAQGAQTRVSYFCG